MFTKKWIQSPFFEARGNYPLDIIIIHHIGSEGGKLYSVNGTLTWFTDVNVHKNKDTGKIENKVSAHYVLPRAQHNGNDIYQVVKDTDIAYHAGVSQWIIDGKLRNYINRYSIGIEMEGDGNLVEYTDYQYEVLTWLVKNLVYQYHIPEANIIGHEDIAPGRKVDPGKFFDWKKFRTMLNPTIIIESTEVSTQEPVAVSETKAPSAVPVVPPPNEVKPPNPISHKEESFYMGDGSKTHGGFMEFLKLISSTIFGK
jgi:N-acetyl-anhydromuramyl-L-alanine amidase AmpD